MTRSIRILHVFSTFAAGGPQVRVTRVLNRLGPMLSNTVLAMDGETTAIARLDSTLRAKLLPPPPRKTSLLAPMYLRRAILGTRPDLVVTYNWGAMDAVAAAQLARVCPVIHTEDGFGSDEAAGLKFRRVMARRILLRSIYRTVVPSESLYRVATGQYRLPASKVDFIPNGVDTAHFHAGREPGLRERLGMRHEDVLFGYIGHLRPEKNLDLLIRAFGLARTDGMRLVLVGDGPCRRALEQLTSELGLASTVTFAGAVSDPAPWYRALDVFAMSSITEQMPMALLEAMASGIPAVATDVGDVRCLLSDNGSTVVQSGDCDGLARALGTLARSPALRTSLGAANRARCAERYSEDGMIETYGRLYRAAAYGDSA